ncbi:D-alanyl-D-alanine carboxypeptidase [Orenia metallireducens]|uniref:serine-type D-Ala-D-Ala carboxypeptidase n=1 Tax=Orenia metallireducens TaxID=1413210 RepID=A0A1C0A6I0_9FIRM|nr:D-alanyl-D-alanine carboxypeptidase family protein [Orenia metallireducens]OCL25745.1 D-alanyl-D-alanine carboxypeptidase [Orenia metallireducens]
MLEMRRTISIMLFLLSIFIPVTAYGQAGNFDVNAKSAILMDAESGQVLFAKNEHLELPPASITKIMTALLAMEAIDRGDVALEDKVTISALAESMGGSQVWLEAGEKMPLEDLLKSILIPSANDASVAVAEYIGGTEHNFVRMMNQKAKQLGMNNTLFVNTTGLPEEHGNHHSSAYDIAVMGRELVKHKQIFKWTSQRLAYIRNGSYPIYTTNELLGHFPDADGLKTGWTEEAGYCLAGTASRGDLRLIAVVMGTDSPSGRVDETAKLLNYGFRAFTKAILINSGIEVSTVEVKKGKELEVPIETAQSFSAMIERGTKELVEQEVEITKELEAPVKKGDKVGKLIFKKDDRVLGEVDLVVAKEVEKAGFFTLIWRWIVDFVMGFFEK